VPTFTVINFLSKDRFIDPFQTRKFVTAIPPLTRSILDSLFALVFLFDDVAANSEMFAKGGWRELCEETVRLHQAYDSNPKWTEILKRRDEDMARMRAAKNFPPKRRPVVP
jgi:hypothetical protein